MVVTVAASASGARRRTGVTGARSAGVAAIVSTLSNASRPVIPTGRHPVDLVLQRRDDLAHQARGLARGLADPYPGRLQRDLLRLGGAGGAGDDGPRVAHGLTDRRG